MAAAGRPNAARCVLVGDEGCLRAAAAQHGVAPDRLRRLEQPADIAGLEPGSIGVWGPTYQLSRAPVAGRPEREDGLAQLRWVDDATELVVAGPCAALVTGPVSKAAIAASGGEHAARFRGHTEHLAARFGAGEVVMAFYARSLATSLVTTHLPLRAVADAITVEGVARATVRLVELLARLTPGRPPQVAVAGLNPHAGEGGLLGDEERDVIAPGRVLAERRLAEAGLEARVVGPLGAETAYRLGAEGQLDGVVAMYHDQATIACKLLGFGDMVNITLGLPIVRTSVDHGTAYDIAGQGSASDAGMAAAMRVAARLCDAASA